MVEPILAANWKADNLALRKRLKQLEQERKA